MTRRVRSGPSWRRWSSWHVAGCAVLMIAFASLTRDDSPQPSAAVRVLSAPSAAQPGSRGDAGDGGAQAIAGRTPPAVQALPPGDAVDAARSVTPDGYEACAPEQRVEDQSAPDPETAAVVARVERTSKPSREAAIARRLGWTAGDGREALLGDWLERAPGASSSELIPLFGASDAAAIAQDLAPLPESGER